MRNSKKIILGSLAGAGALSLVGACAPKSEAVLKKPKNIITIYLDDLGYGDLSAYGATSISTPNMDRLANEGVRFTDGHTTSATSTPSRYALLTGRYPWREAKAEILPGSAPLIISPEDMTLPRMLKGAGYKTAIIGKWHLGLGGEDLDWNKKIQPGANELGFDYSYIIAATQDRVPTVLIEDGLVTGLDPNDPIEVSYKKNFEGVPTAITNPELMTYVTWHHGHNNTVINGIPRIGYMKGGEAAHWVDTNMADDMITRAKKYVTENKDVPFFLHFTMHQPHVPRTPHPRFEGKSGLGVRGDVILEADWVVGELIKTLEETGQLKETLIIFSSDNGPVVNDGYNDQAVELLGNHTPAGALRGGKYSLYEGGTRVPFMVYWKGVITPKVSDALVSQMDLMPSLASLVGSDVVAPDGINTLDAFMGLSDVGRTDYIYEASTKTALRSGDYVMIPPYAGVPVNTKVNIELGNSREYQLYNVKEDISQKNNLASSMPEKLEQMKTLYSKLRGENVKVEELVLQ